MTTSNSIEIQLSKGKLIKLLIGSLVFVAAGFWLAFLSPKIETGLLGNRAIVLTIGISSILFFGLCALTAIQKLRDKKTGLIIDNTGITDNASGISAGHIPWSDIKEFKTTQVMRQKFIVIIVNNPDDYISRQTNAIKRKGAAINYKHYGSPINISANTLKCNFEELKNILQTTLHKNQNLQN